jgi:hypothetical protein
MQALKHVWMLGRTYLLNKPNVPAKPTNIQCVNRPTIKSDNARCGIVPSFNQTDNRAFAGAALTLWHGKVSVSPVKDCISRKLTTRAVVLPAGIFKEKPSRTATPGLVG